jgi:signal transduction histidine kinase
MYEKQVIAQGKELGADDYLMKPFTYEDLLSSVRGALNRAQKLNASYYEQITSVKDNILNMLSHEFRTPLTTITGFSQLISENTAKLTEPELKNFLELIVQSSKRLYTLVEDFILSSSIETGESEKLYHATKQKENISELIERVLTRYQNTVFEKKFSIKNNIPDKPVWVFVCSSQISIIIQKILDNAIKFCYNNTAIEISMDNQPEFVEISMKNYGDGIPPDQKDRIFDKFFQINREIYEQQGSGLGLFIANSLATINQCTIECESIEKSYAVFKLKIPVAK